MVVLHGLGVSLWQHAMNKQQQRAVRSALRNGILLQEPFIHVCSQMSKRVASRNCLTSTAPRSLETSSPIIWSQCSRRHSSTPLRLSPAVRLRARRWLIDVQRPRSDHSTPDTTTIHLPFNPFNYWVLRMTLVLGTVSRLTTRSRMALQPNHCDAHASIIKPRLPS